MFNTSRYQYRGAIKAQYYTTCYTIPPIKFTQSAIMKYLHTVYTCTRLQVLSHVVSAGPAASIGRKVRHVQIAFREERREGFDLRTI